jgi:hypothetical protein
MASIRRRYLNGWDLMPHNSRLFFGATPAVVRLDDLHVFVVSSGSTMVFA